MKISNTSRRLNEYMTRENLRQIDILNKIKPLCEKYGVKMGSNDLSQYVTGKVKPTQRKLSILAEALGTSEVWLMGYDVPRETDLIKTNYNFNYNNDHNKIYEIFHISGLLNEDKEMTDEQYEIIKKFVENNKEFIQAKFDKNKNE